MKLTGLVPMQALGMASRKPANTIKENEMDVVPTDKDSNVANGLPQTKGDDKIKLSREHFKSIVREVMKEESEYQRIFQKMLSKFGVNSPADLSDEQKKKFFTLVKGIQTELKERMKIKEAELSGGQHKLDIDKDGDIGSDDLAKLRASKNEGKKLKEAKDDKGNEFPKYDDIKAAVKKLIQSDAVESLLRNKVAGYLSREKGFVGTMNTDAKRLYDKVINDLLKH